MKSKISIELSRLLYYGSMEGNSGSRFRELRKVFGVAEPAFPSTLHDPFITAPRLLRSIEWRACDGFFVWKLNRILYARAEEIRPDIVWIEMGRLIYSETLQRIKQKFDCLLVNSYSDDFMDSKKKSRHYTSSIPLYDIIFTPRDINIPEYLAQGANFVAKFWKGYDPDNLYPEQLSEAEKKFYGADAVFAGHWEPSRTEPFLALAKTIPRLKIWGQGWRRCSGIFPSGVLQYRKALKEEYRKVLCGAKIGIQFLTRWARDTQTSRSFEIPACGTMLLAERSEDHLASFMEDKEAVFFTSTEELVEKARFYLKHDSLRKKIAQAGYERCQRSGYTNSSRIRYMIRQLIAAFPNRIFWKDMKDMPESLQKVG